ncbi:spermidine N1-acetyltransferase [Litorivicinus lipolyticus]|uniref:Spermidine N1-acetyltransferase n=1 Tax=Litorivicinus lipolyticus TaxID=418701 RepID=A0A5Q2Q7S0_9GAMM|nr:spermidine N1-acetyltransferase [Litorivicinus lipolyticus]QGG80098.1 spermidine N1-acetyltransferase [Litorivicinus lipolyticus]
MDPIQLRALERDDLPFVHGLNNDMRLMRFWFEEPYESFLELEELYLKHIHDQSERRFIAHQGGHRVGLVELIEITTVHRRCEFQIIVSPTYQGQGIGTDITSQALDYAFKVLNLNKVYLVVSVENPAARHIYEAIGFVEEGRLVAEFFVNGRYVDAIRMYRLQQDYLQSTAANPGATLGG